MTKISVILAAYNHENYIEDTLISLLSQTCSDLEVIAVDDGSFDKTGEILDRFAAQDHRLHVIHQKNRGVAAATNVALSLATGEWLTWCGSDDVVPKKAYADLLAKSKNTDVVIGEFSEITDEGAVTRVRLQKWREGDCFDALFAMPAMWNKLVRHSLVKNSGLVFPDSLLCEDLIFLARLAALRPRYVMIHKDIYHYRNNPRNYSGSMTHTYSLSYFKAHIEGRYKVLEICQEAGLPQGRQYVFLDSIRYLAAYIPQMEPENCDEAMTLLKNLLSQYPWEEEDVYFRAVFGVNSEEFMAMSGPEYVQFFNRRSPMDAVLGKYEAGDAGLHFLLQCLKAWASYKRTSHTRK